MDLVVVAVEVFIVKEANVPAAGLAILADGEKCHDESAQTQADAKGDAEGVAATAVAITSALDDDGAGPRVVAATVAKDVHAAAVGKVGAHVSADELDTGDAGRIGSLGGVVANKTKTGRVALGSGEGGVAVDAYLALEALADDACLGGLAQIPVRFVVWTAGFVANDISLLELTTTQAIIKGRTNGFRAHLLLKMLGDSIRLDEAGIVRDLEVEGNLGVRGSLGLNAARTGGGVGDINHDGRTVVVGMVAVD
mmetsp:Transcript_13747/g.29869  ORF Transcript_13747/g.29869 Transcript_13747/m.29869 type:complete len:253 (-) Transcript_13747:881-1639(-)